MHLSPDSAVFGAAGFLGRALVAELLRRGHAVAAAVHGPSGPLRAWLEAQGADARALTVVTADVTRPGLGLDAMPGVRDVYNCAARYAFGLDPVEARAVNVTGALNVLEWTAELPAARRLVHLSGYRVAGTDGPDARLGAYESSKREGDAAVRRRAAALGVPTTIANPASVIGPGQYIGLSSMVGELWRGRLPAVPGGPRTFVPVVELGHLARFLAELPAAPETAGRDYWVLDDATPELPRMLGLLAGHLGVRAPRGHVPVPLVRALPRFLTHADPETLPFLSEDRYPTGPADDFARARGLNAPPVEQALRDWADHLVASRFGAVAAPAGPYGFQDVAGGRTWLEGDRDDPEHVLLHGLPLDGASWAETARHLDGPVLAADLPGLGRSGPANASADAWLAALLAPVKGRPLLTAHSYACGPAVRYAARHPEKIRGLVLVAPPFLLAPAARRKPAALTALMLRRASPARLAALLGVPHGEAVESAAASLRRPGVARRTAAAAHAAAEGRPALRRALAEVTVPLAVVTGEADPAVHAPPSGAATAVIKGAGHFPQLTHPEETARAVAGGGRE
ncbi:alpha/beta fold hydrolase [Spirillospora sp. NPDC050679]